MVCVRGMCFPLIPKFWDESVGLSRELKILVSTVDNVERSTLGLGV